MGCTFCILKVSFFIKLKKKALNSIIFYEPFFPEIALRYLLCFSSLLQLPSSFFFRTINSCRSYNILSGFCWIANTWMIFGCSFNIIVHSKYNLKINTHWIKLNFCINFDINKNNLWNRNTNNSISRYLGKILFRNCI